MCLVDRSIAIGVPGAAVGSSSGVLELCGLVATSKALPKHTNIETENQVVEVMPGVSDQKV